MVGRWWREPLIHFLLIGALLFGAYRWVQPRRDVGPSSTQIRLSLDELTQLILLFRSQWQREPTPQELDRLIERKVQDEILYREALAMGLDKDDTIVKRRMAQKMQFLAEDVATALETGRISPRKSPVDPNSSTSGADFDRGMGVANGPNDWPSLVPRVLPRMCRTCRAVFPPSVARDSLVTCIVP